MNRNIFGIGETVLDVLFKDSQPFAAKVGGSVLNALVSLAKTGCNVEFISEIGDDHVGDLVIDFLMQNKIGTNFVHRYAHCQTSIALAFLNKNNDAQYQFYKNLPSNRSISLPNTITANDIVVFGSSYAIQPETKNTVRQLVITAKQAGAIVIYDPNYRKAHQLDNETMQTIVENMTLADIVKGSDEDFSNIFNETEREKQLKIIQKYCKNVIITANSKGIFVASQQTHLKFKVNAIKPLSTIGAGDNFNAGLVKALVDNNILKKDIDKLTSNQWSQLALYGNSYAQTVCLSTDNYVDDNFKERLHDLLKIPLTTF